MLVEPAGFCGGSKKGSEVSVKLQYIVLTLLVSTIYCLGTLFVSSELGAASNMAGLPFGLVWQWCVEDWKASRNELSVMD